MEYLLSIDLGTTGCKVMMFDVCGNPKGYRFREYPTFSQALGYAEQDADEWWKAVSMNLREVIESSKVEVENIKGIGVTGQGTSVVYLDKNGRALRPAIIHMDNRAKDKSEWLVKKFGELGFSTKKIYSNLLWSRENEPEIERAISYVLDAREFVGYMLTGNPTFDENLKREIEKLNEALGIPSELFGGPHGYFTPIGYVKEDTAKRMGLKKAVPVVVGPWDGVCNIIGSGLVEDGIATDVAGGTEIIAVAVSKKLPIVYLRHFIDGLWLTYTSPPLGLAHRWFKDQFAAMEKDFQNKLDLDAYELLSLEAEKIEPGSKGLLFIPILREYGRPYLPGAFVGILPDHTRGHFIRAFLEGVALRIREIFEELESNGVNIKEVRLSGGGAKSMFWNKIRADVTGKPFAVLRVLESGCLGASILAALATKIYSNLIEASNRMVHVAEMIYPDEEKHKLYSKLYEKYKKTLTLLQEIYKELF
ncbi:MAG: FGGY family carbohydrate kinase [Candidatus Bathyarchaeia archaeon]